MSDILIRRPLTLADIAAVRDLAEKCDAGYGTMEASLVDQLTQSINQPHTVGRVVVDQGDALVAAGWCSTLGSAFEPRDHVVVFCEPGASAERREILIWLEEHRPARAVGGSVLRIDRVLDPANNGLANEVTSLYEELGYALLYVEHELQRDTGSLIAALDSQTRIRAWTQDVHPAIHLAYNAAFATRNFPGYSKENWVRAFPPGGIAPDSSFVALETTDVIGFIFGERRQWGMGWIDSIGVVPTHTGRGIATALIARALEGFRGAGVERVRLRVNEDNVRALRLYEHLGFRPHRKHVVYRREVPAEK